MVSTFGQQGRTMRLFCLSSKISAEVARIFAESEFENYCQIQDHLLESDFDLMIKQLDKGDKKE